MKRKLLFILLVFQFHVNAQVNQEKYQPKASDPTWVHLMYQDDPNVFELRAEFETYYQTHEFKKNQHTQFYKRLLKENWLFVNEQGYIRRPTEDISAEQLYLNQQLVLESQRDANSAWEELGPWNYDHEQAMIFEVQSPGSAHVYTVEQSPVNSNLVFAGTATAGLWKSTDKGLSWSLMTRTMLVNSVYAIALDPVNQQVIYFGEENGKIWKSMDGGQTWSMTGDTSFQNQNKWTRDLKIIGTNTLLAATNQGLFRSTDGAQTWQNIQAGEFMEIEIHPTNPLILYTVKLSGNKTQFLKSSDGGLTWVYQTTGWPNPTSSNEQKRVEISVTPANPNAVYVWAAGVENGLTGFYGFYKSEDAGETFQFACCGTGPGGPYSAADPNMLGWSEDGAEEDGQIYYDLASAVSPTDENRVFGAGINVWRSVNEGQNWELNAHWVTWVGANTKQRYSHADVHDIKFFQNGNQVDMWVASDGGLYYSRSQGDTLVPRMNGIHGTDFWGFQAGFKDGDVMLGGTYHNGTLIKYKDIYHGGKNTPLSGGWLAEVGGDNFRGFVNFGNSRIGYDDQGAFQFSTDRAIRKTDKPFDNNKMCNTSYVTGEYGNYEFLPYNFNTFYSPVDAVLHKTENGGISFQPVYDFGFGKVIQVKVSWANPKHIFVTHKVGSSTKIMRSVNAGVSWMDVTPPQNVTGNNSNRNKYIELDEKDSLKLWCILMGSQNGNKVFQSLDGGTTWTNISSPSIAGENVISIAHQYGTNDGLYIGTTRAVYYKNATMTDWALFNNQLPSSTQVSFLQPFYADGKIRAASQRGVFGCDFYENGKPVAMISSDKQQLNLSSDCVADTVQFVDHSTVRKPGATWKWTFEGASPATSTQENPKVVYQQEGTFDVQLIVSDAFGSDTILYTDFIQVTNQILHEPVSANFDDGIFPPLNWKLINSHSDSWEQDIPEGTTGNYVASFPNYWVSPQVPNQLNLMVMPAQDFEFGSQLSLSFDVAFHSNGGDYIDSLALVYRSASESEWQEFWKKGGDQLHVPGIDTYFWYDQNPTLVWRTETVDLNFLQGESCVEIAFSNRGEHGNHIWIDEVNLSGSFSNATTDLQPSIYAQIYPNPSTDQLLVRWNKEAQVDQLEILDLNGKVIQTHGIQVGESQFQIDLSDWQAGFYFVRISSRNGNSLLKVSKI